LEAVESIQSKLLYVNISKMPILLAAVLSSVDAMTWLGISDMIMNSGKKDYCCFQTSECWPGISESFSIGCPFHKSLLLKRSHSYLVDLLFVH